MQSIVCSKAGCFDEINIADIPIPEPKDNQIQIYVKAASLSVSDFKPFSDMAEKGKLSFASKMVAGKKPFGGDVAGVVSKVGKSVTQFKPGDEVYSSIGVNGGCAEYTVVDANKAFIKPENLSFEEASAIPTSGIVAMEACQKANIHQGSEVLVYGASGGVGQFAVQIAKAMGGSVTAVCSTRNVDVAYSIGADNVVDYMKEDITQSKKSYDAILGVNGNNPLSVYKRLLKKGGTYVAIGGKQATSGLIAPVYALGSGKHMTFVIYASAVKHGHLSTLKTMAERNQLKPYVEKICSPTEIKEVLKLICNNHAQGKIVVSMKF